MSILSVAKRTRQRKKNKAKLKHHRILKSAQNWFLARRGYSDMLKYTDQQLIDMYSSDQRRHQLAKVKKYDELQPEKSKIKTFAIFWEVMVYFLFCVYIYWIWS